MYFHNIVKSLSRISNCRPEELPLYLAPMKLLDNLKEITFFFLENSSFTISSKDSFITIVKSFLMLHFYPLYISTTKCTNINFVLILEDYSEFLKEKLEDLSDPSDLTEYSYAYTNLIDQTYVSIFLEQADWEKYIIKDNDDSDS